jgi:hypothetical protein
MTAHHPLRSPLCTWCSRPPHLDAALIPCGAAVLFGRSTDRHGVLLDGRDDFRNASLRDRDGMLNGIVRYAGFFGGQFA